MSKEPCILFSRWISNKDIMIMLSHEFPSVDHLLSSSIFISLFILVYAPKQQNFIEEPSGNFE